MAAQFALIIASIFGFSALVLDAVGAHILSEPSASWSKATQYQLVHALLLVGLSLLATKKATVLIPMALICVTLGVLFFCGGIYLKALMGANLFSKLTPTGGTLLMLSWILVAVISFRS